MDLSTKYLGMTLRTPLVASASPISHEISAIRRLEEAGVSAVVLHSLFEEQLDQEGPELEQHRSAGSHSVAESVAYFPKAIEFRTRPEDYLNHIRKAKDAVDIPIIASLNGATLGGWANYAKQIEQAGADALECNIYFVPTRMGVSGSDIEQTYIDILREVKISVRIPVAVKLSPFFSNFANMAKRLDQTGADGLVLFNRFYQPDIDLDELKIVPNLLLSSPHELRLPLTWIGISLWPYPGRVGCNQWSAWSRGCNQAAPGRLRRHHAVLDIVAGWHLSSASDRRRGSGMDGGARV